MKKKYILCLAIIFLFLGQSFAQKGKIASADKKYNSYAYVDAMQTYERIAAKGYQSAEMFEKLGNAYYFNSDFEKSAHWYEQLYQLSPELDPEYYYRYAQSLKAIGKKSEAVADFASDRPGTIGQSDLYKVAINTDGSFGTPINLGKEINTEGRETFPFVTKDNQLYFASDGHPGLGGLDIFTAKINNDGTIGTVENDGAEVNSPKDDFGYYRDSAINKGFFTSNRDGGIGSDDIYKFNFKPSCKQILKGTITDISTGSVLAGTVVTLIDSQYNTIASITTDASGNYSYDVSCN